MAERLDLALPPWARGVLVVADVHGHDGLFSAMIELAGSEDRLLVSLGDLVDRGPDSARVIRLMISLLQTGKGLFIRGNHDDKLYRTLIGNPTMIDAALAVTLASLKAAADGSALKQRYVQAYRNAPYIIQLGQTVMVHGAMQPPMLASRSLPKKYQALAIYGEVTHAAECSKQIRTYRWLENVPGGRTVIIGHHPISDTTILVRENAAGGRIVHLDCGAGKGRGLGALRLDRDGRIENGQGFRATLDPSSGSITLVPAPFAPVTAQAETVDAD